MTYLPELHYLQDQRDFPFRKAVLVTACTVGRWSRYFCTELIAAKSKQVAPTCRSGSLPTILEEKETFIAELVSWLFENSLADELFCLFLDDDPVPQPGKVAKFDHHDDTCCWVLNLAQDEFVELQAEWKDHGLPTDLFYPEENTLCMPYPGTGLKARLFRSVGVQKCYTPRQWENK